MKKLYMFAMAALACGAMIACCGNKNEEPVADTLAVEEAATVDTLKYVGYPHGDEMAVEFLVANDQLVMVMANGEEKPVLEKKQAMVVYGEAEPTAVADSLAKEYKHVKTVQTSVMDRMNHGEKNNAWIVLYGNEECEGCCHK